MCLYSWGFECRTKTRLNHLVKRIQSFCNDHVDSWILTQVWKQNNACRNSRLILPKMYSTKKNKRIITVPYSTDIYFLTVTDFQISLVYFKSQIDWHKDIRKSHVKREIRITFFKSINSYKIFISSSKSTHRLIFYDLTIRIGWNNFWIVNYLLTKNCSRLESVWSYNTTLTSLCLPI
jgi:hypothetical protein